MRIHSSFNRVADDATIPPNSVADYEIAIQSALVEMLNVPIYKLYNKNYAMEPTFVTWQLRSLARQVFTGTQKVLGIEMPRIQISVFSQSADESSDLANTVMTTWNGYTGYIAPNKTGPVCGKIEVAYQYQNFDDKFNLFQTVLDVALYVTGAPNNF